MVLARIVPGPVRDIGLGLALASGEVRRSLSDRLLAVLAGQGTWSFARHALADPQLPPLQFPPHQFRLNQFSPNQYPPIQLAAPDGTNSRAYQKAGVERDSAESGACAGCDSDRGERQPRPARNPHSQEDSDPRRRRQRALRRFLRRRDPRRWQGSSMQRSSIRSSSVQSYSSSRTNQVAVIKSSKNASSQSQARHEWRRPQDVRSFASPAARVLRSVRSRWQTRLAERIARSLPSQRSPAE